MCSLSSKMLGKNSSAVDQTQVQKLFFAGFKHHVRLLTEEYWVLILTPTKHLVSCLTSRVCFDQKGTKFGLVMEWICSKRENKEVHIRETHSSMSKQVFSCNFPERSHTGGSGSTPQDEPVQTGNKMSSKTEADCAGTTDVAQTQDAPAARPPSEITSAVDWIGLDWIVVHTPSLKMLQTCHITSPLHVSCFYHRI